MNGPLLRPGLRRTIGARVFTLVGLGMLAPLAVMAWAGWSSYGELTARIVAERELVARHTAERLGTVISAELQALHQVAPLARTDGNDASRAELRSVLRRLHSHRHRLFDRYFVVDAQGATLAHEPAGPPLDGPRLLGELERAGRPLFTDLLVDAQGGRRLYALVPIRGGRGDLTGLVGGEIDPAGPHLAELLLGGELARRESVDLLDGGGFVIASTDPSRRFLQNDHAKLIAGLIRDRKPASGRCHGCHAGAPRPERELFAFFPLATVHWGVSVRQPERDAYAFAGTLVRNVAALAAGLLAVALLFAWGAAASVTRPLKALTRAAARLTRGELSSPIPPQPPDEVGELGAALETMRAALAESRARLERANDALEQRVHERTRELEALNQRLVEREAARTRLLRRVITAQEDERKRIARELHDETAQSLAALSMGLDVAARGLPAAEGRKVEEAAALAVRTLDEVRRLIVDLRPSVLDDLGLQSAILWYADRCLKPRGVTVRCEFGGLEGRLPVEYETTLFRVAQEAMTNIARHARAETVLVQCARRDGQLTLEIEDDGQGFDALALARPDDSGRGVGLLGMRERVELLGGTLQLDSAPGEGTRLSLTVPLTEVGHG